MYDILSGKLSLGKTKVLSKKLTQELLPAISAKNLSGGVLYHDGQFDDSRLAINLAQTAEEQGAAIINYCKLTNLTKTGKRITGVVLQDVLTGKEYAVSCNAVINATGIFTDDVMKLDDANHQPIRACLPGKNFASITGCSHCGGCKIFSRQAGSDDS